MAPSPSAHHRPGLGIALVLCMVTVFASMDTSVKYLGTSMPVLLILWVRYLLQALVMAVWLARSRQAGFRAAHPRFQLLRGTLLLVTSALNFYGVQHMPIAEFTAINMLTPLAVTLLAAWFLKESVSLVRWLLVCGGFAGALVVIRPGSGLFGWAVVFPLASALSYAGFQVLTSRLAGRENPFTAHFYTGLTGALIVTPFLWLSPIDVPSALMDATPRQWAMLAVIGALGTTGHLLLILALGLAPTSTLMPFIYVQIAAAAAVSAAVFGAVPDGWGWTGMAVIAACGATGAWMNVRRPSAPSAASPRNG